MHRGFCRFLSNSQCIELLQGLANLGRSTLPLHAGRGQHHRNVRYAALQGSDHIVQGSRA